jgi:taurine dioxygenase
LEFRRLHPDLGAEVIGFDLARSNAPADIAALRAAFDEHELLLFRGDRAISPERQHDICSWFGPCMTTNPSGAKHTFMDNAEAVGRDKLLFHSDVSYAEEPMQGIALHALELPKSGAATAYVSGVAAWAGLAPDLQSKLAAMTSRHRLEGGYAYDWPEFVADKPVRMAHPRTGKPILYVTEHHSERIHELPESESANTLAALFAHLYAPDHVYTHQWRLYDLVLWDNLAIQHARPYAADPADGARILQRVTIGGTPFEQILSAAKAREAAQAAM